ncbi:hypothetical protein C2E23DRAFT_526978 [Lenzites betulinus]|nr:hypothetical protein C2E23DRAFT_526978 [Lenzites betulinus]
MALSACSRRLSGSVRARALSGTASGGQPLGLRSSNTLSGLDALSHDLDGPILCAAGKDNALDALGFFVSSPPAAASKLLGLTALGRLPPARRAQLDAENDAEHTLQRPRRPSAGPLWRPSALCSSSSMNALVSPGHSLVHSQVHARPQVPASSIPACAASPLIRPSDEQLLPGPTAAQAHARARRTPRAASSAVRAHLGAPAGTSELNPQQAIYAVAPALVRAQTCPRHRCHPLRQYHQHPSQDRSCVSRAARRSPCPPSPHPRA